MPLQGIIKGNVVDADDAENGVGADALEFRQECFGNSDFVVHLIQGDAGAAPSSPATPDRNSLTILLKRSGCSI